MIRHNVQHDSHNTNNNTNNNNNWTQTANTGYYLKIQIIPHNAEHSSHRNNNNAHNNINTLWNEIKTSKSMFEKKHKHNLID